MNLAIARFSSVGGSQHDDLLVLPLAVVYVEGALIPDEGCYMHLVGGVRLNVLGDVDGICWILNQALEGVDLGLLDDVELDE